MKKLEWFASFPYGTFEIVIPKSLIEKSTYVLEEGKSRLSAIVGIEPVLLDNAVSKMFGTELSGAAITELLIKDQRTSLILTAAVPEAMQIPYGEFRLFEGQIGEVFRNKGIVACRFKGKTIQYLVDIEKILGVGV